MMENKEITLLIEDMTVEGQGVAKQNGLVYFVEGGLLGGTYLCEIIKEKKSFSFAKAKKEIKASTYSRKSPCPYSKVCHGCPLIELTKEKEAEWKKGFIESSLERLANQKVSSTFYGFPDLKYRNKLNLRVNQEGKLSYSKRSTNDLIPVRTCPIGGQEIQKIMRAWDEKVLSYPNFLLLAKKIKMVVIRENTQKETMLVFITEKITKEEKEDLFKAMSLLHVDVLAISENTRPRNVSIREPIDYHTEKKYLKEEMHGLSFSISPASFFQVNKQAALKIYETAIGLFSKDEMGVLDLYCGTGTTSLLLAKSHSKVFGVESNKQAVEDAKRNAKKNKIDNVDFLQAKAEEAIQDLSQEGYRKVLVDPPRKGLDRKVVESIIESECKELVYISCNPTTLARDIKIFTDHSFQIKNVYGFNQFPNTMHVEVLALIARD